MKCSILSAAGFLLSALAASAAGTEPPVKQINVLEVIAQGGVVMYPLAILSLITVVLILLYFFTIRRNAVVSGKFMDTAENLLKRRDYAGLNEFCRSQGQSMARVTEKAINFVVKNPGANASHVRSLAETEGQRQAGSLHTRVTYLADIGSIAPMIGLVGTVLGMMEAFLEISSQGGKGVRQMELAEGVAKALITTASGLSISILALVFYAFFRGRVQKCVSELEAAAAHLIGLLCAQLERVSGSPSQESPAPRGYAEQMTRPMPLGVDRPDIHGI